MGKMTPKQFEDLIPTVTNPGDYYLLIANRNVTTTVPFYLVADGVDSMLDAGNIYERILMLNSTETPELFNYLKDFLLACLQSHTKTNPSPSLSIQDFSRVPSSEAMSWAARKFQEMFPTLVQRNIPPPQVTSTDTLSTVLASLLPLLAHKHHHQLQEEKKDNSPPLNMSVKERNQLGLMCGLVDGSEIDLMPQWICDCAEKGMSNPFRYNILRVHIASHFRYEDAEVPLTLTLLKMIVKQNWLGKEGDPSRPSAAHALEGLSPFACAYMDSDEIACQNIAENLIDSATNVTPLDLERATSKKSKALVPSSPEEFLHMLQAYSNLLLALFSETCPLYVAMVSIVSALKSINMRAQASISLQAKATILWIILLQSRRFAIGDMSILSEFSKMQADLVGKNTNIYHTKIPAELLKGHEPSLPPPPSKHPVPQPTATDSPAPKRQKLLPNPNAWHPKLKGAFGPAMEKAGHPPLTAIANYCGVNIKKNFNGHGNRCTSNAVLGKCYLGDKCTRTHNLPSEEEVGSIVKLFKKFLDAPEGAKKGL